MRVGAINAIRLQAIAMLLDLVDYIDISDNKIYTVSSEARNPSPSFFSLSTF